VTHVGIGGPVLEQLEALVPGWLDRFETPGVAVAATLPEGAIAHGWGVADNGSGRAVTPATAFAIGSCSKLFTTTLAVALARQDRLRLDDPVVRHLPSLVLYDPWVTREVTLRDLLANRVGLSRETMYEYGSALTLEEVLGGTASVPPVRGFRSGYAYSNVGYVVASQALAAAGGAPFPGLLHRYLAQPLGMRSFAADHASTMALDDIATPHLAREGGIRVIDRHDRDNGMGSGTVNLSAADLLAWLRMHAAHDTDALSLPPAAMAEIYEPHTLGTAAEDGFVGLPGPRFSAYALGLHVTEHLGHVVHHHGGSLNGFRAFVGFAREPRVGVAVAANASESPVAEVIGWSVLDAALSDPERDWADIVQRTRERDERKELDEWMTRWPEPADAGTPDGAAPVDHRGTFRSARYGTIQLRPQDGRLVLRPVEYVRFSADLEPRGSATYSIALRDPVAAAEHRGYPLWLRFEPGIGGTAVEIAGLGRFERVTSEVDA
jgi:CubicO group peptidase (beta-lactamase class C family)